MPESRVAAQVHTVGVVDNDMQFQHAFSGMRAELLSRERIELSETEFVEMIMWRVDPPVRGSAHFYKYRLAYVSDDLCVVRYDNEAGKGDHKHIGKRELRYEFTDMETLRVDFWSDVKAWRDNH